jgi:uncharacterized LabA/DUF88 family protein
MALFVYVDYSNVWIEGMRFSAVRKGLAADIHAAMNDQVTDQSWRLDFGRLYGAICPDDAQIGRSSLFGSRPPDNDSLWEMARRQGFEVEVFDRNFRNKEKEVDVAIATQVMADSYEYMSTDRQDRVVLVSGDRDYLPTLKSLESRGFPTTVVFWSHGLSHDLRDFADDYFELDGIFDVISHSAAERDSPE